MHPHLTSTYPLPSVLNFVSLNIHRIEFGLIILAMIYHLIKYRQRMFALRFTPHQEYHRCQRMNYRKTRNE